MKKIILADDHSFIRLGLIQILKDEYPSVEIKEVENGEALVNEVMKHDFDLVISDLEMPGRSGLEALEQIKIFKPNLPVLILSIYPEDLYAVRVLKAGAFGYMNKNAAPYELITAVQHILTGRKYITPEIGEKLLQQFNTSKKPHEILSNREFEIFKLIAQGKSLSQIADSMAIALTTVSTHRGKILKKLNITTNAELIRYALSNNIIKDVES
jgi:two-component system, NarL family, invasion response regulator UvrY